MLHFGLVGHERTITITTQIIHQNYQHIRITPIIMNTMDTEPIVTYIKANEYRFDGLLFTGKIPYDLVNTQIISEKPWVYIQHDISRLLSGLLESMLLNHYDLHRVSFDSYCEEDIYSIYNNLNIDISLLNLQISQYPIYQKHFLQDIKLFHQNSYTQKGVSFCVTGISDVYECLVGQDIPCVILDPTKQSIDEALICYESKKKSLLQRNSQIVVLVLERDLPDEHALINENEYQFALESMKVSEDIYLFSQRIQAAVIENGIGKYMLFTTKYLFEAETEYLQKINILTKQREHRLGTLSIGIGYGETAREAKYNANLGLLKAKKQGGNRAYKVEHNKYFGPILANDYTNAPQNNLIDGDFQHIATKASLSLNSIIKLQTIIDQQKNDTFTPIELAGLYNISPRSMNRLLEKLLDSNYAKIVGCNMRTNTGRPSRIIQLCFRQNIIEC
jgi:hypothetical protein